MMPLFTPAAGGAAPRGRAGERGGEEIALFKRRKLWYRKMRREAERGGKMTIFKNPHCVKVRGSHLLEVSCAHCKCLIARYRKVGESNLVKMYAERIVEGTIDFSVYHGALFCPRCGARIATRYTTKMDHKEAYRLVPSAFHKKKVNA